MRFIKLILGDIRFQWKYGFYFLYLILSIFYICIIFALPSGWRANATVIAIYTDPAALGLFFMGAIVLLEKSQRVMSAIAVSPVTITEYIFSKVISLMVVSCIVATVIAVFSQMTNIVETIIGTALSSMIFTLLGLIVASKISSLNQFIIATAPIEIICIAPALYYLFDSSSEFLRLYPCSAAISLMAGIKGKISIDILILFVTIVALFVIAYKCTKKMQRGSNNVKI